MGCSLEVEVLIIPYLYSPSNLLAQVGVGKHSLTKVKCVPTQALFSDIAKLADVNCPQNIFLASLKPWALHPSLASPKFIDTSRKELIHSSQHQLLQPSIRGHSRSPRLEVTGYTTVIPRTIYIYIH